MQFYFHAFFCLSMALLLSAELSSASTRQQKMGGRTYPKTKAVKVYHNNSEQQNQEPESGARPRSSTSSVPSCQVLRQIWRHFKRQSRNPKANNEVPDNVDQWLRALGYSRARKNRSRKTIKTHAKAAGKSKQPVFGRVVHGPDQLDKNLAKEEKAFEILRELTSDYRRQRSPLHWVRTPHHHQQQQLGESEDPEVDVGVERLQVIDQQQQQQREEHQEEEQEEGEQRGRVEILRQVLMAAEKSPPGAAINRAVKDESMVHIGREVFSPSEHRTRHLDSADYPRPFDLLRWNLSPARRRADSPQQPQRGAADTQTLNGPEDTDPRDLWQALKDLEQSSSGQAEPMEDTLGSSSSSESRT